MAKRRKKVNLWPMRGTMIGVHPKQVQQAQARLEALEAPGTYDPKTGDLILASRRDYKEFCRKTGRKNQDAGYGDWPGANRPDDNCQEIADRLEWARRKGKIG